jgi:acyl-CoA reductase-like NAD-dependent aldehyde dehydrogenase
MAAEFPILIDGDFVSNASPLDVTNPFDGAVVGRTWLAGPAELERATTAAQRAFSSFRTAPVYERATILHDLASSVRKHRRDVIDTLVAETGKPVNDATVEVDRGAFTIQLAAEEASRILGEVLPLDVMASSKNRFGITRRFPIGPIAGISPFNFPLNLSLHKVAPAIAAGNSIVLKPPTAAPLTMLLVARLAQEAGVPAGVLNVLPMDRSVGAKLVADDRFKLLSFTGSPDVGWEMKRQAGNKRVVLELGGNAGVLIDEDADLEYAVGRIRTGAFAFAGQVCISVQRVFVHESVYTDVRERLVEATASLRQGNPADPATELGPMIDDKAAARTQEWVDLAVQEGARILTGGHADGRFFAPTIIEHADPASFVCSREAFAPLLTISPVASFAEGIERLNDSSYGLQAGVFTNRLEHALDAYEQIEAGGVIINDVPTFRVDHMPYGGLKDSGIGREGIKYAIEDMTEVKLMVINRLESQRIS